MNLILQKNKKSEFSSLKIFNSIKKILKEFINFFIMNIKFRN